MWRTQLLTMITFKMEKLSWSLTMIEKSKRILAINTVMIDIPSNHQIGNRKINKNNHIKKFT